jgi:hypothetical protein
MGHERVGYLPKTERWKGLIRKISHFSSGDVNISDIATETTRNVRSRFKVIKEDPSVVNALKYLLVLVKASKKETPIEFLKSQGVCLPNEFNVFDLTKSGQTFIERDIRSKEYSTLAIQSLVDTIGEWSQKNQLQKSFIFDSNSDILTAWRIASNGKGFCELSRIFFSKFTTRYLKYFLEREASSRLQSLSDRESFTNKLELHIQDISKHAFETAKIAQSFSAGWYNLHAKDSMPSDQELKDFLSFSFKKINSELLREEDYEL